MHLVRLTLYAIPPFLHCIFVTFGQLPGTYVNRLQTRVFGAVVQQTVTFSRCVSVCGAILASQNEESKSGQCQKLNAGNPCVATLSRNHVTTNCLVHSIRAAVS